MANIELRVRGQRLLVNRGYVVAGTVRYLTIKAALSEDWQGREVCILNLGIRNTRRS